MPPVHLVWLVLQATIADLSICHAPGVTLAKIEREMTSHLSARTIPRPDRSTELRARDRLFFAGSVFLAWA